MGSIAEIINRTANTTKKPTLYQLFLDEVVPDKAPHIPELQNYGAIGLRNSGQLPVLLPTDNPVTSVVARRRNMETQCGPGVSLT